MWRSIWSRFGNWKWWKLILKLLKLNICCRFPTIDNNASLQNGETQYWSNIVMDPYIKFGNSVISRLLITKNHYGVWRIITSFTVYFSLGFCFFYTESNYLLKFRYIQNGEWVNNKLKRRKWNTKNLISGRDINYLRFSLLDISWNKNH